MKKTDIITFLVSEKRYDEGETIDRTVEYSVAKDGIIYINGKTPNGGLRSISAELLRKGSCTYPIPYGYVTEKLITPVSYRALLARLVPRKLLGKEVTDLLAKNYMDGEF